VVAIADSLFLTAADRFAQRQVACHREQVGKTRAKWLAVREEIGAETRRVDAPGADRAEFLIHRLAGQIVPFGARPDVLSHTGGVESNWLA